MYFDLTDFLDSLKGLTRDAASREITSEMESLEEFHRIAASDKKIKQRTFTREYNFLKLLVYEIQSPGESNIKSVDREVVNEVLMNLKSSTPVKVVKKAKTNQ